jgi:hypothetical protein
MVVAMLPGQAEIPEELVEDVHVCEVREVEADEEQAAVADVGEDFFEDGAVAGLGEAFVGWRGWRGECGLRGS